MHAAQAAAVLHGRISRRLARITGLVTLLAALVCAAGGAPAAHAAYPGQEGRIAFVDRNLDLRMIKRDGRLPRSIGDTGGGWYPSGLAASPDGRRVAYSQWEVCDGCGYQDTRIAMVSADGGEPVVLYHDKQGSTVVNVEHPTWSPDGKQLAFAAEALAENRGLYVIDVAGGEPRKLPLSGVVDVHDPAWSPDGNRIAFTGRRDDDEPLRI